MGKYLIADGRNPFMGLDNKICRKPAYWCRAHKIWMSEEDVGRKRCMEKPDYNMIGTHRCGSLVDKRRMEKAGADRRRKVRER